MLDPTTTIQDSSRSQELDDRDSNEQTPGTQAAPFYHTENAAPAETPFQNDAQYSAIDGVSDLVPTTGLDLDGWSTSDMNWMPLSQYADLDSLVPHLFGIQSIQYSQANGYGVSSRYSVSRPPSTHRANELPTWEQSKQTRSCESPAASRTSITETQSGSYLAIEQSSPSRSILYVDGRGGRESKQSWYRQKAVLSKMLLPPPRYRASDAVSAARFSFPTSYATNTVQIDVPGRLSSTKYAELKKLYEVLAAQPSIIFDTFGQGIFPPILYLEECFQLYCGFTSLEFPVIHETTWKDESVPCVLLLAAITAGSTLHPSTNNGQVTVALHELLRRAIRRVIETGTGCSVLQIAQVCLLNAVGAWQVSRFGFTDAILSAHADLGLSLNNAVDSLCELDQESIYEASDTSWRRWIVIETISRLSYFSQLIQAFSEAANTLTCDPSLERDDIRVPSSHDIWAAASLQEWFEMIGQHTEKPTMRRVLQDIYQRQSLSTSLDFGALTHVVWAVIRKTFEAARDLQRPLGRWTPVAVDHARRQLATETVDSLDWLPANDTYAAWRNSACDCLDTIHWRLHTQIAATAGLEGPAVLHLHLARLLLLTPFTEIIDFAHESAGMPVARAQASLRSRHFRQGGRTSRQRTTDILTKWLVLDKHKSRLSLVHAGAIFWHVRRFRARSLFNSFTVLLAALVLWVYGTYQPQVRTLVEASSTRAMARPEQDEAGDSESGSSDADSLSPRIIVLDRPCDDEIVQLFVRHNHDMEIMMSGSANVCTKEGVRKILREGVRLLHDCQYAGFVKCSEYQALLANLITHIDQSSETIE